MRVRVNHTFNTFLFRKWPPPPVEIEALRRSVELNPCPRARRRIEDFRNINWIGISFEEQSASWMRQNRNEWILHGPDHAAGHLNFTSVEYGMNGRNDVIEVCQDFV